MSRKRRGRSRRRSHLSRTSAAAFPSPSERERIIERRDKLLEELITATVMYPGDYRRIDKLVREYGPQEVTLVLNVIQSRSLNTNLISDESSCYREYRRAFARFGGDRRFLNMQEYDTLSLEHAKLNAERKFKSPFRRGPSARERELSDLLLVGVAFWEDITPPAVPPRPDDFEAPAPGDYDYPVRKLLQWGWDLDEQRMRDNTKNVTKWWPAVPELVRMVLDEGLLNGWPGEKSSWAPYHALYTLGYLRAHKAAGQLFPLFEQENDWLSDRLSVVWGLMGPQAEPPLWDYLDNSEHDPKNRGIVMLGLATITEAHPDRRSDIIAGLVRVLQHAFADDAEANAYIVHVLYCMQAVEAKQAIFEAFEQGKVDESIIQPYDVDFLDWQE